MDKTEIYYKSENTPILNKLTPNFGSVNGKENIILEGENFGSDKKVIEVIIDGVLCEISSVSNQKIQCITGQKFNLIIILF